MIPLFKTWGSIGKSILNVSEKIEEKEGGADNIIAIALENKLSELTFVEDSLLYFLQIYNACRAHKIKMHFGFRVNFCSDITNAKPEELHKNVIFLKKSAGYPNLVKLASLAGANDWKIDYNHFHKYSEGLELVVPFYDSYIANNLLSWSECIPDYRGLKPNYFVERNELPIDFLIEEEIRKQVEPERIFLSKSIYYKDRRDSLAFQTRKLMENKKAGSQNSLDRPNLDGFSSTEFCFESWMENKEYGRF